MVAVKKPLVRIQRMDRQDLSDVMRIERASYDYPWSEGIFQDCLRADYSCCVAVVDESIVAYAIFQSVAGEAHILNLCVDSVHRHLGYARVLLDWLFEAMKVVETHTVFLEVRPTNIAAIKLYDTLGFNEIGVRKDYYRAQNGREDALILARYLDWS